MKFLVESIDTIHTKVIIDTLRMPSKDSMDLLNKMDSFYNNSWSKLMIVVTIAFSIIGIIMPILVQWYQKKELKLSEEKLRLEIKQEIDDALKVMRSDFKKEIDEQLAPLRMETRAGLHHIQGLLMTTRKSYNNAARDYLNAVKFYLQSNVDSGLTNAFKEFIKLMPNCTVEGLATALKKQNTTFEDALKKIKDLDKEGKHSISIETIENLYKTLKHPEVPN